MLLCVCIFLGLFSVSAHAEDDTQSFYDVVSSWYPENWNDEKFDFEGTIKADQNYPKIYIESTIMFAEPTELGVVNPIDLVVHLDIGGGSVAVEKTEMYGTEYNVISNPDCIYDSSTKTLTFKDLTSDVKASQIFVVLSVTNPVYDIKNIPNFTIDGVQYRGGVDITTWEAWVNSSYNTGGFKIDSTNNISTVDGSKKVCMLRSDGMYAPVTKDEQLENTSYILQTVTVTPSIDLTAFAFWTIDSPYTVIPFDVTLSNAYIDGCIYPITRITCTTSGALTVYYKTSSNGSTTMKSVGSNGTVSNLSFTKWQFGSNPTNSDFLNFMSVNGIGHYRHGGGSNDWGGMDGPSASYSLRSIVQDAEYHFPFSVLDLEINVKSSEEIQGGIFAWVKKIFKSIVDLPKNIANSIKSFFTELGEKILALGDKLLDGIKNLFVPTEQDITDVKGQFEELLSTRFGAVYESTTIIDDFSTAFSNASSTEEQEFVTFPTITVNLVDTPFSFGGWQVDVVPDGFEFLVNTLKMITSIACTFLFVNAMRKRLEDIFKK